ncbi:MAG: PEP/pyruvate-binding domain-containing protein, partial [Kiritimatiellia bacterium]|nr:PEP/pyruvate-binding domain-containing protein [Kiritimatiellia bacterium]
FVNVRGAAEILKHVRLVWASLWSDAALLYRKELGLDVRRSRMAVLVQSLAEGTCSGVAFSRNPHRAEEAMIEAVYGLNAGLVDGTIEPDRWTLDRGTGRITSHTAAKRSHAMAVGPSGIERQALDPARSLVPPLGDPEVGAVCALSMAAEKAFGVPQDVEWTHMDGELIVLQSRPITTLAQGLATDKRAWYRSLSRSFENLKALRRRIEENLIPGMRRDAEELAAVDLSTLADDALDVETRRREALYRQWRDAYWADCIPFAHGVRLFGQYYNDQLQPRNPYEFMDLLGGTEMLSLKRNRALETLARMIRENPVLHGDLERGDRTGWPAEFREALDAFGRDHGDVPTERESGVSSAFLRFLLEMASLPVQAAKAPARDVERLRRAFLAAVPEPERIKAEEMLDLARASHRWRDDDNVYLDAVEAQWRAAQAEERRRRGEAEPPTGGADSEERSKADERTARDAVRIEPRQLVGQPAGPGIATGVARVVEGQEELLGFKRGEILVCDALSPTMTFVISLASAVVERRGGMLIHGAIIAREYGIPCVTGVPDAARSIRTGMHLTVDGYLGLVRVHDSLVEHRLGDPAESLLKTREGNPPGNRKS